MNRKGFTLIELLAVIVVLALILVITFPNLTNVFKNSKLKNEQIFVDRLSQTIDSYVSLNSDQIMEQELKLDLMELLVYIKALLQCKILSMIKL